jgi:hypothetical protein
MSSFLRSLLVLSLFMCVSLEAHATNISVDSQSVTFPDTYVGGTQGTYVTVRIPTNGPHTVLLSLDDTVNFAFIGDSTPHNWTGKYTYVQISFHPRSKGIFNGTLTIQGESNTVTVSLHGAGLSSTTLSVVGSVQDTMVLNTQYCSPFVFYSPNSMPSTIVAVEPIRDTGPSVLFTLPDGPQNGHWVRWGDSTLFHLCIQGNFEAGLLRGKLRVVFRDSSQRLDSVQTTFQTQLIFPHAGNPIDFPQQDSSGVVTLGEAGGGTTLQSKVYLHNQRDAIYEIDTVYITGSDKSRFTIKSYGPRALASNIDSVTLQFNAPYPYQRSKYDAKLIVGGHLIGYPDTLCDGTSTDLTAYIVDPPSDTTTIQLPDTTHTISVTADTGRSFYQFVFHNGTGSRVHISNIRLTGSDSANFAILTHYSRTSLNDTVADGDDYIINISFDASHQGTYETDLAFTMSNAFQDYHYKLVANVGSLGVKRNDSNVPAQLIVSPNPVRSECLFTSAGIPRPHYSIFDLLGNKVTTLTGESWNVANSQALPGVYFVRAEGYDLTGQPIVKTARIVVEAQ